MKNNLTDLRKEILNIIENNEKPITAQEIMNKVKVKPNLSSVYRALNYLQNRNFICSVAFMNNISFYYKDTHPMHFIFCKECNEIKVFHDCCVAELEDKISKEFNYKITNHVFYFIGICEECHKSLIKKEKNLIKK